MATVTGYGNMRARQRETAQVVVERYAFPIVRGMAGRALRAKLAVVFIILLVTGITIRGRALENSVDMT